MANIPVFTTSGIPLAPCHPARARIIVAESRGYFEDGVLILTEAAGKQAMTQTQQGRPQITNWSDLFREEHDIYLQNVSEFQISLSFKGPSGEDQSFVFKRGTDPVNITQHIPFATLAQSMDFRRHLNSPRRPFRILTEEEFIAYFEKRYGTAKVGEAIQKANEGHHRAQTKMPDPNTPPVVIERQVHPEGTAYQAPQDLVIRNEDVIHARVLSTCASANPEIPDEKKIRADAMINEFEILLGAGALKADDIEYIRAHGYWRTVKAWARSKADEMAASVEGDG